MLTGFLQYMDGICITGPVVLARLYLECSGLTPGIGNVMIYTSAYIVAVDCQTDPLVAKQKIHNLRPQGFRPSPNRLAPPCPRDTKAFEFLLGFVWVDTDIYYALLFRSEESV